MLSKKDIIELNKQFHTGHVINEGSLDYAVQTTARSRNWLRTAAVMSRIILVDHVFEDGNKRTAAAVIMLLMELSKLEYYPEKIPYVVVYISKKSFTNIKELERCIKNGLR